MKVFLHLHYHRVSDFVGTYELFKEGNFKSIISSILVSLKVRDTF